MLDLIANVSTVGIVWYGGLLVMQNALTLGELVAFTTYIAQLVRPVRRLGAIVPAIAQATSAGERIFEVLDAETHVVDAPDAVALPSVRGHVRFEGVTFGYLDGHIVLDNITFEAKPGQVIALLGAHGIGQIYGHQSDPALL